MTKTMACKLQKMAIGKVQGFKSAYPAWTEISVAKPAFFRRCPRRIRLVQVAVCWDFSGEDIASFFANMY